MSDTTMHNWTCFDLGLDAGVAHVRMNQPQRHNAMAPAFRADHAVAAQKAGKAAAFTDFAPIAPTLG